jgi:glucose-1-phosphate thymidylyltransferase
VNKEYLRCSSLHKTPAYVQATEKCQGMKLGCPEEAALHRGFIPSATLKKLVVALPWCEYRDYLTDVANEVKRVGLNRT